MVFEAEDLSSEVPRKEAAQLLKEKFKRAVELRNHVDDSGSFTELVEALQGILPKELPRAAVKELLPLDDAVNKATAIDRMKAELDTLHNVQHSSLVKLLDADAKGRWFAMEYFPRGSMSKFPEMFKGRALAALKAFRPIVGAVAEIHKSKVVHRDIKPENIFIGNDERLVLGDCGLAIKLDNVERLTTTYENVGSRDWMPGWAMGMLLQEVEPNFDVFSLGKLLWSMVSGRSRLQLWYYKKQQFDLERMFENGDMFVINNILSFSVVEEPEQCLRDAGELLVKVDEAIAALEARAQRPSMKREMWCRFCGLGRYSKAMGDLRGNRDSDLGVYVCENCGHVESFFWPAGKLPKGWETSN